MRNWRFSVAILVALGSILLLLGACQILAGRPASLTRPGAEDIVIATPPPGCPGTFAVTTTLPPDIPPLSQQPDVNCFAWQTFIALNWPAGGGAQPADFGKPGDLSPTVWQAYKATQDVFLPGATPPAPWGAPDAIPAPCPTNAAGQAHLAVLYMTAKASDDQELQDVEEATGEILVDQTGNLIHFEKRVNQVEFNYITTTQLYNGATQYAVASNQGLTLPPGAIEIKAAWRRLDGQPDNVKARYKQTTALLYDAHTGTCEGPFTMGLIALHIIRKTSSMRQLMWSTFEQVDNVPGSTAPPPGVPYTLYNPNCKPPSPCTPNATPQPTPAPPATPVYAPVQVTRALAIPSDVQKLNAAVQTAISQTNPASVWQYYQLVNVLWPRGGGDEPAPRATVPVSMLHADFQSSGGQAVSNVALETYVQTSTCTDCHSRATIATSQPAGCTPALAADFSFVFDDADTPDHFGATCPQ